MIRTRMSWVAAAAAVTAGLSACNLGKAPEPTPDVNALYTLAAQTLIVQSGLGETQTAAASSPTLSPTPLASFTPLPTFGVASGLTPFATLTLGTPIAGLTPLPTQSSGGVVPGMAVGCNNAVLIGEKPADGTVMSSQKEFQKSWSLQNTGTCPWDENYSFAFKSGEQMSGEDIKIVSEEQFTEPGHSQAFIVHLAAPKAKGEYKGYWQMKSDTGEWFGALVWVDIIVG
jgi:hypothetical protein